MDIDPEQIICGLAVYGAIAILRDLLRVFGLLPGTFVSSFLIITALWWCAFAVVVFAAAFMLWR